MEKGRETKDATKAKTQQIAHSARDKAEAAKQKASKTV